jgi:hypothetical protein
MRPKDKSSAKPRQDFTRRSMNVTNSGCSESGASKKITRPESNLSDSPGIPRVSPYPKATARPRARRSVETRLSDIIETRSSDSSTILPSIPTASVLKLTSQYSSEYSSDHLRRSESASERCVSTIKPLPQFVLAAIARVRSGTYDPEMRARLHQRLRI